MEIPKNQALSCVGSATTRSTENNETTAALVHAGIDSGISSFNLLLRRLLIDVPVKARA